MCRRCTPAGWWSKPYPEQVFWHLVGISFTTAEIARLRLAAETSMLERGTR